MIISHRDAKSVKKKKKLTQTSTRINFSSSTTHNPAKTLDGVCEKKKYIFNVNIYRDVLRKSLESVIY